MKRNFALTALLTGPLYFKLNVSFGFILRNNETSELQYYFACRNNEQLVFEEPFQFTTATDLQQLCEALQNLDVLDWVRQRRPNSKWVMDKATNITFFIAKLQSYSIARGTNLPAYLAKNRGLVSLDRNRETGKSLK